MSGIVGLTVSLLALALPIARKLSPDPSPAAQDEISIKSQATKTPTLSGEIKYDTNSPLMSQSILIGKLLKAFTLISANAITYFVIKTMSDWTLPYMIESKQLNNKEAVDVTFWTEVRLRPF